MKTVNDLKLCDYVEGDKGKVLKVVSLIDHPESNSLRRVGYKDMTYSYKDVFTNFDLPKDTPVKLARYIPKKISVPSQYYS